MKRLFCIVLAMIIAACAMTAFASAEEISITDMMGREVKLSAPAQRIVALTAAD